MIINRCLLFFVVATSVFACADNKKTSSPKFDSVKEEQYYVQGEILYTQHCSNCHQETGTGLGLVYPPLKQSDYLDKNFESVICLMKNGIKGELIVNGKSYNKEMPGIPSLSELEITEISTYIYNTWGNKRDSIDIIQVRNILSTCEKK